MIVQWKPVFFSLCLSLHFAFGYTTIIARWCGIENASRICSLSRTWAIWSYSASTTTTTTSATMITIRHHRITIVWLRFHSSETLNTLRWCLRWITQIFVANISSDWFCYWQSHSSAICFGFTNTIVVDTGSHSVHTYTHTHRFACLLRSFTLDSRPIDISSNERKATRPNRRNELFVCARAPSIQPLRARRKIQNPETGHEKDIRKIYKNRINSFLWNGESVPWRPR